MIVITIWHLLFCSEKSLEVLKLDVAEKIDRVKITYILVMKTRLLIPVNGFPACISRLTNRSSRRSLNYHNP